MSDLVSIIMPSYNTAQYITETIQSVIDQTLLTKRHKAAFGKLCRCSAEHDVSNR